MKKLSECCQARDLQNEENFTICRSCGNVWDTIEEEPKGIEENWDYIIKNYGVAAGVLESELDFYEFLKDNYNPPTRKL